MGDKMVALGIATKKADGSYSVDESNSHPMR